MKNIVLFIVGPTASGKSALACRLARELQTEIISADSMQIYRGMDIGTAKISSEEANSIPHHLIDICDPSEEFTVYHFREAALEKIKTISAEKKVPVIAGGTGLYVRAILEGLSPQPGEDPVLRKKLEEEMELKGTHTMYRKLTAVDPGAVKRIHPNHKRRIIRALEIYEMTGRPASEWYAEKTSLRDLGYEPVVAGLEVDKKILHERINERVDQMFEQGLLDEVRNLLQKNPSKTALQAVGYKEVVPFLQSVSSNPALDLMAVKDAVKKNTRYLAKRQMTWFRKEKEICWYCADNAEELADAGSAILKKIKALF